MSKLLIIGNGFDMHCNLNTSYEAFFIFLKSQIGYKEAYDKLVDSNHYDSSHSPRINLWWALLLSYHEDGKSWMWKDIEQIMLSFLYKKSSEFDINLEDIIANFNPYNATLRSKYNTINILHNTPRKFKFLWLLDRVNNLEDFFTRKVDFFRHSSEIVMNDMDKILTVLRADLKQLENDFFEYLRNILHNANQEIHFEANLTYAKILEVPLNSSLENEDQIRKLNDELNKANILSFNYTRLGSPKGMNFTNFKNIHGTVLNKINKEIIFGIDSIDISPINPIYVFTKTYRLSLLEGKLIQNSDIYNGKILLKEVDDIRIYGHSLNKQDYSYFFAIFNKANIDESDTTITLFYSNFNDIDKSQERSLDLQLLIYEYECKFGKSKGLYHRMLIEGRIAIKVI
ncbi:MAG: bacteriophage abortive infection AbiH family protein [Acholeplasmataceae bacterium]|nr:bacteriophage abortive infection AbiH family protein [Acholeplasmataceae bacterium]